MRQGKLSELIHNSDRYPDLQQCSVEIHFREITDLVCRGSFLIIAFPFTPCDSLAQTLLRWSPVQSSWSQELPISRTRATTASMGVRAPIRKFKRCSRARTLISITTVSSFCRFVQFWRYSSRGFTIFCREKSKPLP